MGGFRRAYEVLQEGFVLPLPAEERLRGRVEKDSGRGCLRVVGIARLEKRLGRKDRVRPRRPTELLRRPLGQPRRFLGGRERRLETAFLETLSGLLEELLHPIEIDIGFPPQGEARIPLRRRLGLEFHEDFGRVRGACEGLDEIRLALEPMEDHPVPFPQFPELPRPEPVELVRHPTPACLRHEVLGPGERGERFDQRVAIRIPRRIDAVGLGKALQHLVRQGKERFPGRRWHSRGLRGIKRAERDKRCAASFIRRTVSTQNPDRPLDLPELGRVTASVRMVAPRLTSIGPFDRGPGWPPAPETRRMDPDILKAENAERRLDAFRLEIELPQVRENASRFVAAFDAVPQVPARYRGPRTMVVPASKTEETLRHGPPSPDLLKAFLVRRQRLCAAAAFASTVSFRSGPSVFKDQGKLSFDYLPDKMVHREQQTQRLFSLLRPIVEAGVSSHALPYGPRGTGKTHTAKRFCLDFKRHASESDRAVDWDLVNCRQRMGDDAALLKLIQHFDTHFPERGLSIADKMEQLRRHLEKHKLHFIVILDEVDALLKKSGADLIYSFARIAEETIAAKGNISMILISQRSNALEYMDRAALSTFRRSNVV